MSILTSITVNFAVILWISFETESATMLAYAAIAAMLPQALLGPVSGVFIDRWNRKRTMIIADSFIAFCTLILAVLFWLDIAQMWHIFVLLALRSVGSAFHAPAMQASVPLIAPKDQLTRVAGINQMINSVGNIAGPALGMFLIMNFEMQYVLMIDIVGAAVACISLLFITIPNPQKSIKRIRNVFCEMKEGAMAVLKNRGLSWVFLFSVLVTLFLMPVNVLFPLMTTQHFGGGKPQVTIIEIVWGVGALVGGAIMGAKVYNINKVILLSISYFACGLSFVIPGLLSPDAFGWFVAMTAFGGITGAVYNSAFTALVQTNIEPGALGRVFSMFYTFSLIPSMLGLIGIGFFAASLGVANSFIACGSVIILIGFLSLLPPSAIRIDSKRKPLAE